MSTDELTSPVVPDVLAAMGAHRLAVIDGRIDDEVLLYGERMALTEAIAESWRSASGAIVVVWTPAGGLRVLNDDERPRIETLLSPDTGAAANGASPLDRRDPLDVAMMLARLFEQERERILVIVDNADLVAANGSDPYARRNSAALLHAVESFGGADELHAFVMITRDPTALPASVTRATGVASLRLGAPGFDERSTVAAEAFGRPSSGREIQQLAISTDGFGLREVRMLHDHSLATQITLDQPRELAASFRHGHRVDHWASLTDAKTRDVERGIRKHVFGQDLAVNEVLERLEVGRSGLELDPPSTGARKSRLELFLVGPTGVGKNELARALARELFGDPGAVMSFDMNAFQQEHSGEQLFGAPPGYVGHDRGSPLVDRLRERPFSVIVFDEIEKAHDNNWLRLMAAIDEGRVTDTRHVQASLENAIVIFTSNIGAEALADRALEGPMSTADVAAETRGWVKAHLSKSRYELPSGKVVDGLGKPEVWGRLTGSLVAFDVLREDAVEGIVSRFCSTLEQSAFRNRHLVLSLDRQSVCRVVTAELGTPGTWNGRDIKGHMDRVVRRPLAKKLITDEFADADNVSARIDGVGLVVERG